MDRAAEISMPMLKASSAVAAAATAKADIADQVVMAAAANAEPGTWSMLNSVPWGNVASAVAAAYTFLLISEWFWKKVWRPLAERRGWIKPKRPRLMTVDEYDAYLRGDIDTESSRL